MANRKHTGTGRLLANDEGSGALLFDPDTGRLLADGNIYIDDAPEEDPEVRIDGVWTNYWPADWDWRYSRDSGSVSAGFGYAYRGDDGEMYDQSHRVSEWLHDFLGGTGIPSSGTTGTNASSYAFASCSASATTARIRAFGGSLGAYVSPVMQGSPVYDSFEAHYWRIPVHRTGPYGTHVARFREQDEHVMPSGGFYGGATFLRSRNGAATGWRYVRLAVGKTFDLHGANPRTAVQEHLTVDIRATSLPFATTPGGASGGLDVSAGYNNTSANSIRLYGTLRYHYE